LGFLSDHLFELRLRIAVVSHRGFPGSFNGWAERIIPLPKQARALRSNGEQSGITSPRESGDKHCSANA